MWLRRLPCPPSSPAIAGCSVGRAWIQFSPSQGYKRWRGGSAAPGEPSGAFPSFPPSMWK